MSAASATVPLGAASPLGREGRLTVRRVGLRVTLVEMLAGGLGAVDVFVLLWFVLPTPDHAGTSDARLLALNAGVFFVFLTLAATAAHLWGRRSLDQATEWLREGRPATAAERAAVLRQPLECAGVNALGWAAGVVVFGVLNLTASVALGLHVALTIVMGGLTSTALGYLLAERALRPVTVAALAAGPVARPKGPGVVARLMLAWVFATGVPLAGLLIVGVQGLAGSQEATLDAVARSTAVLAALGGAVGLLATWLVARALADPLTSMRRALGRIEGGDLTARVAVEDGSEVGLLQSGFNAMAAGLAERERLRDVFGRHVGEDVARQALDAGGPRLGGEVRDVAVLFVDLIGSTSLAARRAPEDVVRLLNGFFAVVVEVVGRHGGWVNKFEGDAALAIFGAPADHDDPAGAALAAGRELRRRLHVLPGVDAALGVSAGPAVAGYVGAEERFEYTVIGNPVNEAARLCELSKRRPERLLAAGAVLELTRGGEAAQWTRCGEVVLRGRRTATPIARPLPSAAEAPATAA
jgi:adenylate cyclase